MIIRDYIEGLTQITFDKAVIERIALDRGISDINGAITDSITQKQRDLIYADLLRTAYYSPTTWASISQAHGSFSQSVGAQTFSNKNQLRDAFLVIYKQYEDPLYEREVANVATMQFIDIENI